MNEKEFKQIEYAFKHSDCIVLKCDDRVFVAERVLKHRKEATVEFQECYEVDKSCFDRNGEYWGETVGNEKVLIFNDYYPNSPNAIPYIFYKDELVEEILK